MLDCCSYLGQEEIPKILEDAPDYHGFPEGFSYLRVRMNNVEGVSYSWLRDDVKITKDTVPPFHGYNSAMLLPGKQTKKEYAGIYQIVVTAKAGIITGRKITVAFTCKLACLIVF